MRRPSYGMRLRIQLLLTTGLALALVLGGIVVVTSVIGHFTETQNADAVLDAIVAEGGTGRGGSQQGSVDQYGQSSEETLYEARYFSVTCDEQGSVTSVYLGNTTLTEDQALQLVDEMRGADSIGGDRGSLGDYRYRIAETDDGSLVVFLDRGRQEQMLRSLVTTVGLVSLVAAGLSIAMVFALSKRIVKPILDSNAKQRRFITDAGHDIKTPLTIISADNDVLRMDLEAAGMADDLEWCDDIRAQVSTLTELTNRLIYISKMEEGEELRSRSVDLCLSDVAAHELQSFRSRAKTCGKSLDGEIQPDIHLLGDEAAISQMIRALLDNAFKYSDDGGTIRLTVGLSPHGRTAKLCVYNTASEVDRRSIAHWFDRFYQEDESRTHRQGGFGIGLSMVQAVVDAHGGKVQGTSKDGRSVQIEVTLPVRSARETRREKRR